MPIAEVMKRFGAHQVSGLTDPNLVDGAFLDSAPRHPGLLEALRRHALSIRGQGPLVAKNDCPSRPRFAASLADGLHTHVVVLASTGL